ncbi:uncharacterized protein Z519_11921 [Cladophialophora bantiana CBS 173.52]|uniref:Xylulose 5-phosphate/Fructose 6-phosphate phosphoketolase N-terminal domain-containing protein n=1 Tax=Cladophialophora bantiana (strain ATCC 10958 / CBS 173.52 / CDC B-1940 / NIH 8579) TaxID=1442370 RepID=A0A0D2EBX5_CLAB1|nr:uncharacterized protein Z519_11921 [Cladophialophora bantiana CBS 173.52]KIW87596.1 hypothetical protein Z519_11921 [Cladophialophora bantiana CBS 173.52]
MYSHLNLLIKTHDRDMLYVVGLGHGAPSILANLWLEGSLARFYPHCSQEAHGLYNLISKFSTRGGGFPSCISAETPGATHEGRELGCALSVSSGAVIDNPDLIDCCIVGDGECQTGPTTAAWHDYKNIDAADPGAVLPVVHVSGFTIRWSGHKKAHGQIVEGSYKTHQLPLPKAKTDPEELKLLQEWLESYKLKELFKDNGDVIDDIKFIIPETPKRRPRQKKEVLYSAYRGLKPFDWHKFVVEKGTSKRSMRTGGKLPEQIDKDNPKTFRIFSPDEFEFNKLDAVLNSANRNFQWDQFSSARGGRLIETLSGSNVKAGYKAIHTRVELASSQAVRLFSAQSKP